MKQTLDKALLLPVGRVVVAQIVHLTQAADIKILWLTVNINNRSAIESYKKMGFEIAGSVSKKIGGGFVMDGFKMTRDVTK